MRRSLLKAGGAAALGALLPLRARAACGAWPFWEAFAAAFVQADGRVIDDQQDTRYTTSEGQAYSLFFALVAGDRRRFEGVLAWTDRHLAEGRLGERLPGWRWGRGDDGKWALLDANSAADADLWLAHTLLEAARLWAQPAWRSVGHALLARIREQEVAVLPELGPVLLPAPLGFRFEGGAVRLNPSYMVLHQYRAMAREDPDGPWLTMAQGLPALMRAMCPHGMAPDWVRWAPRTGWHGDPGEPHIGSYDAVRVYLWAGMLHEAEPLRAPMLGALQGMARALDAPARLPPRSWAVPAAGHVDRKMGAALGTEGPPGFAAALLPYAQALHRDGLRMLLNTRVRRARVGLRGPAGEVPAGCHVLDGLLLNAPSSYYDQVLALFGLGFVERRFGFDVDGRLWTEWSRQHRPAQGTQENAADK